MLVVRRTPNPASDLARGWSAWGGEFAEHPAMLSIDEFINHLDVSCADDADEVAELINNETSLTIRKCPATGLFASMHHLGLSSYALSATTVEEAIAEAAIARHDFLTGGVCAVNPVAFHHVGDDIYIFECESIELQLDS
jgi:hypothetical protein